MAKDRTEVFPPLSWTQVSDTLWEAPGWEIAATHDGRWTLTRTFQNKPISSLLCVNSAKYAAQFDYEVCCNSFPKQIRKVRKAYFARTLVEREAAAMLKVSRKVNTLKALATSLRLKDDLLSIINALQEQIEASLHTAEHRA